VRRPGWPHAAAVSQGWLDQNRGAHYFRRMIAADQDLDREQCRWTGILNGKDEHPDRGNPGKIRDEAKTWH